MAAEREGVVRVSATVGRDDAAVPTADGPRDTTTDEPGSAAPSARPGRLSRTLDALGGPVTQAAAVVLGVLGSIAVALTAVVVGQLPGAPRAWWFTVPESWNDPANVVAVGTAFYASLGALSIAWLLLGLGVRAGRWRIRRLWLVAGAWALPWMVAPVALSTDVYTYMGQGLVYRAGMDPYTSGPVMAGLPELVAERMAPIWLDKPSPYGPGFMGIDGLVAPLARYDVTLAVIAMRVITLGGLVLAAVCLPRLARRAGGDPVVATWIGVTSPLALGAAVLSGHNDLLMVGLVVAALALATQRYRYAVPGALALAALATTIKAPAAVAVAVLCFAWMWAGSGWRQRLGRVATSLGIWLGVTVLVSAVTGIGTNWINLYAISSPKLAAPTYTPVNAVTADVGDIASYVFGSELDWGATLSVVQLVAAALAAALALVVLARLPRIGVARGVGLLLGAVVLASPVTWPWYFAWPVLLLGAFSRGWVRAPLIVLGAGTLFLTQADGSPHLLGRYAVFGETVLVLALVVGTGAWVCHRAFGSNQAECDQFIETPRTDPARAASARTQ